MVCFQYCQTPVVSNKACLYFADLPETASALAEHSFFEYQRLVQKEAEPELIIQLPNRPEEQEDFRPPLIESEDASTQKDIEISVTVAFAIEQPKCGLFFRGKYGYTDNQVSAPHVRPICIHSGHKH